MAGDGNLIGAPSLVQEWTKAFVTAQSQMPNIPKNKTARIKTKTGADYSYKYADLPDILTAIRPILVDNGLALAQTVTTQGPGTVSVTTHVYHSGGHAESFGPVTLPAGNDAQSAGSAITYARRYSLCAALGIAADEDDDGQLLAKTSSEAHRPQSSNLKTGQEVSGATVGGSSESASSASTGEPKSAAAHPSAGSPRDSGKGVVVGGEVSGDLPHATDLIQAYGKNKVLVAARNIAKANNLPQPTVPDEIDANLAVLVGKHFERVDA